MNFDCPLLGALLLSLIASCGDASEGMADVGMTVGEMAPGPEMSSPEDLTGAAGFCQGTELAGTCVARFFSAAASCAVPSGTCTSDSSRPGILEVRCWPNGVQRTFDADEVRKTVDITWKKNGADCLTGTFDANAGSYLLRKVNESLSYDERSLKISCPDGTSFSLARGYGGCLEFGEILEADPGICMNGTCN